MLLHLLQAFGGPGRTALGFTPGLLDAPDHHRRPPAPTWVDGLRGVAGGGAFDLDPASAVEQVRRHDPHVVFLCSPNNPTGTALALDVVEAVHDAAPRALVVVDEAYAEFARPGTPSALTLLEGRPRLVVTRTMSKAFALAGGRLGYLAADPALVDALRLVRMPYHLSTPTQAIARAALPTPTPCSRRSTPSRSSATGSSPRWPGSGSPRAQRRQLRPLRGLADATRRGRRCSTRGFSSATWASPTIFESPPGPREETTRFLDAVTDLAPTTARTAP